MIKFKSFENTDKLYLELALVLKKNLKNPHHIMLSGGSTPYKGYAKVAASNITVHPECRLFLSDERYISSTSIQNNAYNLYPYLKKMKCLKQFIPIDTNMPIESSTLEYQKKIDEFKNPELGLLGIGEDGHTAGIFSKSNAIEVTDRLVLYNRRPDGLYGISVSKNFIHRVRKIILLAVGINKKPILNILKNDPSSIIAGLILNNHPNIEIWTDVNLKN